MKRLVVLLLSSIIFNACHKEDVLTNAQNSGHDIFVAGEHSTSAENFSAAYWKNGVPHDLPESSNSTVITSIFVDGNDVYCLGYDYKNDSMVMWKNDKKFQIEKSAYGNSLIVSQGDVFIAGVKRLGSNSWQGIAKVWKNGVSVNLTDGTSMVFVSSMVIHDNDVYVTGSENKIAKYWKNGKGVNLTDGTMARSIFVKDNDVYVCGEEVNQSGDGFAARYWENGITNLVEDGASGTSALAIIAAGNNLYVGYNVDNAPKYLKDGRVHSLPFWGYMRSMTVVDDDVYILGAGVAGIGGPFQPLLCKNGVLQPLRMDSQSANVRCLFVK